MKSILLGFCWGFGVLLGFLLGYLKKCCFSVAKDAFYTRVLEW